MSVFGSVRDGGMKGNMYELGERVSKGKLGGQGLDFMGFNGG